MGETVSENLPCFVLTINSGSSSLKFAVYQMAPEETLIFSGIIERIGLRGSRFFVADARRQALIDEHLDLPDHDAAIKALFARLQTRLPQHRLDAAGHRVVHGGVDYNQPSLIDADLLTTLETLVRLAPEHLPHELKAIRAVERNYPDSHAGCLF